MFITRYIIEVKTKNMELGTMHYIVILSNITHLQLNVIIVHCVTICHVSSSSSGDIETNIFMAMGNRAYEYSNK